LLVSLNRSPLHPKFTFLSLTAPDLFGVLFMRSDKAQGSMACPVCAVSLVMSDRQGIEIDYCPQCRGVWLDRGELDKIIERSMGHAASDPQPAQPVAAPQAAAPQPVPVMAPVMAPAMAPPMPYPPIYPNHGGYYPPHYYKHRKHWLHELFD
jgi:uncharacterized protein